jgi:hypothetical protein
MRAAIFAVFLLAPSLPIAGEDVSIQYRAEPPSPLSRFTASQVGLLEKLNRADRRHLPRLPHIVVPGNWFPDESRYSPLPHRLSWATPHRKALVVHLPSQTFGAYKNGQLVRWGPISSGRRAHPTPSGNFNLNWRSRLRRSTDNAAWRMLWYFNFHSGRGLAFHEYSLPGYPASHACVRLLGRDARWLFDWGEGWMLTEDRRDILESGTPVTILGQYDYNAPPPWRAPAWWDQPPSIEQEMLAGGVSASATAAACATAREACSLHSE